MAEPQPEPATDPYTEARAALEAHDVWYLNRDALEELSGITAAGYADRLADALRALLEPHG